MIDQTFFFRVFRENTQNSDNQDLYFSGPSLRAFNLYRTDITTVEPRIKGVAVLQGLAQISWIEGRNDKYTVHRIHRTVLMN